MQYAKQPLHGLDLFVLKRRGRLTSYGLDRSSMAAERTISLRMRRVSAQQVEFGAIFGSAKRIEGDKDLDGLSVSQHQRKLFLGLVF